MAQKATNFPRCTTLNIGSTYPEATNVRAVQVVVAKQVVRFGVRLI